MLLVDDELVVRVPRGAQVPELTGPLATTTTWWWRLAAAVHRGGSRGRLSRPGAMLPEPARRAFARAVDRVPQRFTVLDLRELLPDAARLAARHRVNLLAAEPLEGARRLDAGIVVSVDGAFGAAADAERLGYTVIDLA